MRRAIVNFKTDGAYNSFKAFAEYKNISLSSVILELAQKALESWEYEQLADIALEHLNNSNEKYCTSNEIRSKLHEL